MSVSITEMSLVRRLVAAGNDAIWYEDVDVAAGTMTKLAASDGDVDTSDTLTMASGYQKAFIANGTNLKIVDFQNTKITTADIGDNPPDRKNILTGETSEAEMVVDFISSTSGVCSVYGYRITTETFVNGETVTGKDDDGNDISFVLNADEVAPPHWYDWTPYGNDTDNYGSMPDSAYIVFRYRGRMGLTGDPDHPHQWYMTYAGNPFSWEYNSTDPLTAVKGQNASAGELGEPQRAAIPFGDDFMIMGSASSIHLLNGDPALGGSIDEIHSTVGIFSQWSWFRDGLGNLYFYGTDGNVYRMLGGRTAPQDISSPMLPELSKDWAADPSVHRVVLSYDPINAGILLTKTTLADGTNESYWYSLKTEGWYPESYPDECGVYSSVFYSANSSTYRTLLLGSKDGYIRCFKTTAKNDDAGASGDIAINSYMAFPIVPLSEDPDMEGKLTSLVFEAAGGESEGSFGDPDQFTYSLYVGDDPETVLEDIKDGATARETGTVTTTGRQTRIRKRVRGAWLGLKIGDNTASKTWCLNKAYGTVQPAGKVRV